MDSNRILTVILYKGIKIFSYDYITIFVSQSIFRIRMLPSFVSHTVWARLLGMGERDETKVTVFHGVPAMYAKLTADHSKMFDNPKTAEYVRTTLASRMRLMCAGSAPLPDSLFQKWEEVSN